MRIIATALGLLGLVGIVFGAISVARLPVADIGHTIKTVILLIVCAGALFSLWSALRERWPDLRECTVPGHPYLSVAAFIVLFFALVVFAAITIAVDQMVTQPEATIAFRLGLLIFLSLVMLLGAWTFHPKQRT